MQEKPQASTVNGAICRFFIAAVRCRQRMQMTNAKTNRCESNGETTADSGAAIAQAAFTLARIWLGTPQAMPDFDAGGNVHNDR